MAKPKQATSSAEGAMSKASSSRKRSGSASLSGPSQADASKRPRSEGKKNKEVGAKERAVQAAPVASEDVDFPRGGGSGLSALEHAQALRELKAERGASSKKAATDEDLFTDGFKRRVPRSGATETTRAPVRSSKSGSKRKSEAIPSSAKAGHDRKESEGQLRIEHLNYKRLAPGMRLLCSVIAVYPLAVVLSLPGQLLGHVPMANISSVFSQRLEDEEAEDSSGAEGEDSQAEDDDSKQAESGDSDMASAHDELEQRQAARNGRVAGVPELRDLYRAGDWVRASVVSVRPPGAIASGGSFGRGREGAEYLRESQRVELTLDPNAFNEGVVPADVLPGFTMPVAVRSKEDHGYVLDAGIEGLDGFATFKEAPAGRHHHVGSVLDAVVLSKPSTGRSFVASLLAEKVRDASLSKLGTIPRVASLLPGSQVQGLITSSTQAGLNVKLWGIFDATIDLFHLPALPPGKSHLEVWKEGRKISTRILWESGMAAAEGAAASIGADPTSASAGRRIALSAAPHVLQLSQSISGTSIAGEPQHLLQDAFPIGTRVKSTVLDTQPDWGLHCSLEDTRLRGFVRIAEVADEHVEKLPANAGPYAVGTKHDARVIGHAPVDQVLLLSLRPTVLSRTFMLVSEVEVGSVLEGTIKSLRPQASAIMVSINGHVDGVVFPLHFADVPLKNPAKKYRVGQAVKTRVVATDPGSNRIVLTLKRTLIKSDLPIVSSLEQAKPGVVTHAVVSRLLMSPGGAVGASSADRPRGIIVDLFGSLRALVPISEATDNPGVTFPNLKTLQSHFFVGKCVKIRLTGVDHESGRIYASIKQASAAFLERLNVDAVAIDAKVDARVAAVHEGVVVCELEPSKVRALVSLPIVAKARGSTVEEVRDSLQSGELLSDLVVVNKNPEKGIVILGPAKSSGAPSKKPSQPLAVGVIVSGAVRARERDPNAVNVTLTGGVKGRLHAAHCADDFAPHSTAPLPKLGDTVEVSILRLRGLKEADVSLRPSVLAASRGEPAPAVIDPVIESPAGLTVGDKCVGFVRAIADAGLFLDLGPNVTARVQIAELFDGYVKEWKGRFSVGQVVRGTVVSIDKGSNRIEFSLRTEPGAKTKMGAKKSEADTARARAAAEKVVFSQLQPGQVVRGFVKGMTTFGVFVQIEGTRISGLAHKTELSDNAEANAIDAFHVGDRVKAKVLKVSLEDRKVAFGLKPSYFEGDDGDDDDDDVDHENESGESSDLASSERDEEDGRSSDMDRSDSESEGEMQDSPAASIASAQDDEAVSESSTSDDDEPTEVVDIDSHLAKAASIGWSGQGQAGDGAGEEEGNDSGSESSESEGQGPRAAHRARKKRKGLEHDATADLATKTPESVADFERLLLGSPNSSYLWIQFMSFQLQLSEIDKAREVARRALKIIAYREEGEKLNVWLALLNLENTYGSASTFDAVFREAVQANDAKTVHLRALDILEKTGKEDRAEELWRRTAKKFGYSSKVWVGYQQFLLRLGRAEDARAIVPRSMQSLEKRKHVKTIAAFALSEFRLGDPERGRTIFEGLVDSHPQRLDIWIQYIDQEVKHGSVNGVRALFQRVTSLRQSRKKAKSLFSKWHGFEKRHGDAQGEQEVLARARAYVQDREQKPAEPDPTVDLDADEG